VHPGYPALLTAELHSGFGEDRERYSTGQALPAKTETVQIMHASGKINIRTVHCRDRIATKTEKLKTGSETITLGKQKQGKIQKKGSRGQAAAGQIRLRKYFFIQHTKTRKRN